MTIRVKLYVLNENRQWDDKGKGYVSVVPVASTVVQSDSSPSKTKDLIETDENSRDGVSPSSSAGLTTESPNIGQLEGDSEDAVTTSNSSIAPETENDSSNESEPGVENEDEGMMIIMRSEADNNVILLQSKIHAETLYQKQQDTLIVWNSETEGDLALSFEEIKGCSTIYDQIWAYQNEISENGGDDSSSCDENNDSTLSANGINDANSTYELGNISAITSDSESVAATVSKCYSIKTALCGDLDDLLQEGKIELLRWDFEYQMMGTPKCKDNLCNVIESEKLIPKLITLFKKCEDDFNIPGLENLYTIFKSLLAMGKLTLYEILFSEACIDDVIGILEYPPGKPRQRHREFVQNATLREAFPIKREKLLEKIKQTFKVQYIHDAILPTPPLMEEMNLYTIQSFIYVNKAEIVNLIQEDEPFLLSIISQISKEESSYEEKKNSFGFLKELCAFSQCLNALKRESFFVAMIGNGILKAISHILCLEIDELASQEEIDDTVQLQWAAVEVFAYFIEVCPNVVRDFILTDHRDNVSCDETLLINLLLYQMLNDRDAELGGALQVLNLFRILLDFSIDAEDSLMEARHVLDPFSRQIGTKDNFLSMFYSRCVPILITQVLAMTTNPEKLCRDDYRSALSAQVVMKLLIYCLSHGHGFHIRTYLLKNELIGRFLVLMKSKHVFLVLTSLKFIRTIIGLKDDVFIRHIVANKLLQPIVNAYISNGHKYNLLNSALIEFFDFIKTENIKLLILHFGENYLTTFQDITYVTTFQDLKTRYHQLIDLDKIRTPHTPILSTTEYSDSENASDKSMNFSPKIDSPTSQSINERTKSFSSRNAKILDYDWLNSEDDDDPTTTTEDPTKQLLAENDGFDDEKWMEQWDFHTSQLQKKRQQKRAASSSSNQISASKNSVFEPPVLKKTSASVTSKQNTLNITKPESGGTIFSIAPIKKFAETLTCLDKKDEDIFEDIENDVPPMKKKLIDCNSGNNKSGGKTAATVESTSLATSSQTQSVQLVAPTEDTNTDTSTPNNSLVDYDSDSDEDYAADIENCGESEETTSWSSSSHKPPLSPNLSPIVDSSSFFSKLETNASRSFVSDEQIQEPGSKEGIEKKIAMEGTELDKSANENSVKQNTENGLECKTSSFSNDIKLNPKRSRSGSSEDEGDSLTDSNSFDTAVADDPLEDGKLDNKGMNSDEASLESKRDSLSEPPRVDSSCSPPRKRTKSVDEPETLKSEISTANT